MARIDKYNPVGGGFRAPLAAAWAGQTTAIGVGLNSSGQVVAGIGASGIVGVLCKPDAAPAGSIVDIMKDGEIVEFTGAAGTAYTANTTTGVISNAAVSASQIKVGTTVEATRLVVGVTR
jgi:hypothetical protein